MLSNTTNNTRDTQDAQDAQDKQHSCLILSIAWYDAVDCAMVHVTQRDALCYEDLRADLQATQSVVLAYLEAHPMELPTVVRVCNSAVFASNTKVLLAGEKLKFALQIPLGPIAPVFF